MSRAHRRRAPHRAEVRRSLWRRGVRTSRASCRWQQGHGQLPRVPCNNVPSEEERGMPGNERYRNAEKALPCENNEWMPVARFRPHRVPGGSIAVRHCSGLRILAVARRTRCHRVAGLGDFSFTWLKSAFDGNTLKRHQHIALAWFESPRSMGPSSLRTTVTHVPSPARRRRAGDIAGEKGSSSPGMEVFCELFRVLKQGLRG